MSDSIHVAQDFTEEKIEYIAVAIDESGIKEKAAEVAESVKDTTVSTAKFATASVADGISKIKKDK